MLILTKAEHVSFASTELGGSIIQCVFSYKIIVFESGSLPG